MSNFPSRLELEEANARQRAILESATVFAVVVADQAGIITDWNAGAEHVMGWAAEEMRGRSVAEFFTPEDRAINRVAFEMRQALEEGRASDERWHMRKDGQRFWASGEMMPLHEEGKGHTGYVKILRDRTEQHNAAVRQQAEAAFMHSVLASSADCIKVLDLDGKLTFMNEGGMQAMEISDFNEVKGCPWPDFWVGQGNLDAVAAIEAAKAGGIGHFQGAADTYLGTPKWWDVQVTPIRGADGAPNKILAVSRDISGQKSVETRLATSEARWRGLFDGMQEGFFLGELVRDADGRATDYRFVEINPAFARQSGLPVDSSGRTIRSFLPDIDQCLIDNYASAVETGLPVSFEMDVPGLNRSFEVRASKEQDDRFSCLFFDVTARRQAETRRAAIVELGDYLRDAATVLEMTTKAADIVGRILDGSRAGYGEMDATCDNVTILWDAGTPGEVSIVGRHRFTDYGAVAPDIARGDPVTIHDVATDARTAKNAATYAAINLKAMLNVPVQEHGRTVGLIFVHSPTVRAWTSDEVAFARNVADRVQAGIARLRAEDQQDILNRELSHRMKNMLAMVQAIATQTLRNAPDLETARQALSARIVAMGKAHDLLLEGRRESATLHNVVKGALAVYDDAQAGRLRLDGPNIQIGSKASLSLALMIHELGTNAAKYGALSTAQGCVIVSWEIDARASEPMVRLCWIEEGGPLVTPPSHRGFGTRLIERGVAGAIGASVHLTYPPEGVVCELTATLAEFEADE